MLVCFVVCVTDCGLQEFREAEGEIMSPNFPDHYPNNVKCGYNIISRTSDTITIIFDVLDIEFHENCIYDYISVSYVTSLY